MKIEEKDGTEYFIKDGKMYFTINTCGDRVDGLTEDEMLSAIELFICDKCEAAEEVDFNVLFNRNYFPVANAQEVEDKKYCLNCYLEEARKHITKAF